MGARSLPVSPSAGRSRAKPSEAERSGAKPGKGVYEIHERSKRRRKQIEALDVGPAARLEFVIIS